MMAGIRHPLHIRMQDRGEGGAGMSLFAPSRSETGDLGEPPAQNTAQRCAASSFGNLPAKELLLSANAEEEEYLPG